MRDAQSALDQVLAFGGAEHRRGHGVRGARPGRARAAARPARRGRRRGRARACSTSPARLVESGHDLRHVCRELARLVRDLMVLQVDPQRDRAIPNSRSKATASGCVRSPPRSRARTCCAPSSWSPSSSRTSSVAAQPRYPPRDGAAALGAPAQAGAARGAARGLAGWWRRIAGADARPARCEHAASPDSAAAVAVVVAPGGSGVSGSPGVRTTDKRSAAASDWSRLDAVAEGSDRRERRRFGRAGAPLHSAICSSRTCPRRRWPGSARRSWPR